MFYATLAFSAGHLTWFLSFFVSEVNSVALFFVTISIFMQRPPLSHLYNLTNAQLSIFFPFSQSEIYRQEAWHAVTTIVPLQHTHTRTHRAHLLVFGIILQMFNIKGGFELQAGSGWWWWWWGCSRPGQWTVGILWSPTDLPSPGIPTSLSDTQDKRSSIFLSAHPFVGSYWSVEMSWKLNYLLTCSLKMLSMTYCARHAARDW